MHKSSAKRNFRESPSEDLKLWAYGKQTRQVYNLEVRRPAITHPRTSQLQRFCGGASGRGHSCNSPGMSDAGCKVM